jgi:hypothetical protein
MSLRGYKEINDVCKLYLSQVLGGEDIVQQSTAHIGKSAVSYSFLSTSMNKVLRAIERIPFLV